MPKLTFVPPTGSPIEVDVQGDQDLLDICDEVAAPVPFSCRSATCGTCGVWVEQGEALMEPPSAQEQALQRKLATDGRRFACSIRVRSGEGEIRLRVCGSEVR